MSSLSRVARAALVLLALTACGDIPDGARVLETLPRLEPDYTGLVIPPNIAPMNFLIDEDGGAFAVRVSGPAGPAIEIDCPEGQCRFDADDWRRLLRDNAGEALQFDVFARRDDGGWVQYARFANTVAREPIDAYIAYRQLFPNKKASTIRGIFQRSLESFQRDPVITLRDGTFRCFNCHTFHNHDPNRFLMHVRYQHAGMVLVLDGQIKKISTKQGPMFRPMAFAAWHPDGRHIAATLNMYVSHFPGREELYYFQAVEKRGDLVVYDVENNTISTTEAVFEHDYIETHPCWSHDGRYIYYVRSRDSALLSEADLSAYKFDLARVAYDAQTDTWGQPETVKAYSELGRSCAFPRPSPDGRYVLHILADKSTYPIHQRSSDLYLLDLETREHRKLDRSSSGLSESFPRWSSNGRWFSLTSNRRDGNSTLPYFAYFDTDGQAHKAFLLPQEDPTFYTRFTDSYNTVELIRSRITLDPYELAQAIQLPATEAQFANAPVVDAYTGATWTAARVAGLLEAVEAVEAEGPDP